MSAPSTALPSELAALVRKAPVVLYTTVGCAPCEEGRSLLQTRGIPIRERRIEQAADQKAMQDLGLPATGFPVLTVGQERVIGFESGQWQRILDAAQYPTTSMLPRGWQPEPSTPLAQGASSPIHRAAGPTVGARNPDDAAAPAVAADASVLTPPPMAPSGLTTQSAPSQSGSSRIRF